MWVSISYMVELVGLGPFAGLVCVPDACCTAVQVSIALALWVGRAGIAVCVCA